MVQVLRAWLSTTSLDAVLSTAEGFKAARWGKNIETTNSEKGRILSRLEKPSLTARLQSLCSAVAISHYKIRDCPHIFISYHMANYENTAR